MKKKLSRPNKEEEYYQSLLGYLKNTSRSQSSVDPRFHSTSLNRGDEECECDQLFHIVTDILKSDRQIVVEMGSGNHPIWRQKDEKAFLEKFTEADQKKIKQLKVLYIDSNPNIPKYEQLFQCSVQNLIDFLDKHKEIREYVFLVSKDFSDVIYAQKELWKKLVKFMETNNTLPWVDIQTQQYNANVVEEIEGENTDEQKKYTKAFYYKDNYLHLAFVPKATKAKGQKRKKKKNKGKNKSEMELVPLEKKVTEQLKEIVADKCWSFQIPKHERRKAMNLMSYFLEKPMAFHDYLIKPGDGNGRFYDQIINHKNIIRVNLGRYHSERYGARFNNKYKLQTIHTEQQRQTTVELHGKPVIAWNFLGHCSTAWQDTEGMDGYHIHRFNPVTETQRHRLPQR